MKTASLTPPLLTLFVMALTSVSHGQTVGTTPPCPHQLLFNNGPTYFYSTRNCNSANGVCSDGSLARKVLAYPAEILNTGCSPTMNGMGECVCNNLIEAIGESGGGGVDYEAFPDQRVFLHGLTNIWVRHARVPTGEGENYHYYKVFEFTVPGMAGNVKKIALRLKWKPKLTTVYLNATRPMQNGNPGTQVVIDFGGGITKAFEVLQM